MAEMERILDEDHSKREPKKTRDKVFTGHVLKKLYGEEYASSEEMEKEEEDVKLKPLGSPGSILPQHNLGEGDPLHVKSYTVTPPPPDWSSSLPVQGDEDLKHQPAPSGSESESESDQETFKRKRPRRGKRAKHASQNLGGEVSRDAENNHSQDGASIQRHAPGPALTKNKKRKLKKKRRRDKVRSQTRGDFVYQPQEDDGGSIHSHNIPTEGQLPECRTEVLEFLGKVWEVYYGELNSDTKSDLLAQRQVQWASLKERLVNNDVSDTDVQYLVTIKSLATAGDMATAVVMLKDTDATATFLPDDRVVLEALLTYWSKTISTLTSTS